MMDTLFVAFWLGHISHISPAWPSLMVVLWRPSDPREVQRICWCAWQIERNRRTLRGRPGRVPIATIVGFSQLAMGMKLIWFEVFVIQFFFTLVAIL